MHSYPSRSEKRELRLYTAAEKGKFSLEKEVLYHGEISRLRKQGFSVHSVTPYSLQDKLYLATIDWSNAYGKSIPHLVYSYTHRIIETCPKHLINSLAQELYVIAQRITQN